MWLIKKNTLKAGLLFMLLLGTSQVFSQEVKPPGSIFLETDPSGAFVMINNDFLQETSPAFLTNLAPGEYVFDIWKEGYQSVQKKMVLKSGEVLVLKAVLEQNFTTASFPGDASITINGRLESAESTLFLLPHGNYNLIRVDGKTRLSPIFPDENRWIISALGLGLATLGAGAATYYDLNNPWSPNMPLSPPTIGIYSLFLGDLGWFISLSLLRSDFEKTLKTIAAPAKFAPASANSLMNFGEKSLGEGNFDQAITWFQTLLEYYPDSALVPEALFRLGRIHTTFGRLAQAESEYRLIIQEYPLSSIWDRTQKALSDLSAARGDFEKALFHLSKIVYLDPLISVEDVQAAREDIQGRLGEKK